MKYTEEQLEMINYYILSYLEKDIFTEIIMATRIRNELGYDAWKELEENTELLQ